MQNNPFAFISDYEVEDPKPFFDTLGDWLESNTPKEEPEPAKRDVLSPFDLGARIVKGAGLGVVKGVMDLPSALGDFLWKRGVLQSEILRSQYPLMTQFLDYARTTWPYVTSAANANAEAIRRGAFSDETRQRLRTAGEILAPEGRAGSYGWFPGMRLAGEAVKHAPDVIAAAPDIVGQFVGAVAPEVASYGTTSVLAGVAAARTVAQRTVRHLAASTTTAIAHSSLFQMRDGESSWMKLVRDVGINTAFEVIGMSSLRRAWGEELGAKAADTLTRIVSQSTGAPPEIVAARISQIRAGGGALDPELSQRIVDSAKVIPEMRGTPLEFNAKKGLAEFWDGVVPKNVTLDSSLGNDYGISFDVLVDGQPVVQQFRIHSRKDDLSYFARRTDAIANRIVQLTQEGKVVKLENVKVGASGAWTRFVRRLKGEPAQHGRMDARRLTAFEESLRAAPRGTVAESGVIPPPGTRVSVTEPGRPPRVYEVAKAEESEVDQLISGLGVQGEVRVQERPTPHAHLADPEHAKFATPHTIKYVREGDRIVAKAPDGTELGALRFEQNGNDIRIDWLQVNPNHQRKGIGKTLFTRLRSEFPGARIDRGDATEEGMAFRRAVPDPGPAAPAAAPPPTPRKLDPNRLLVRDPVTGKTQFIPSRQARVWLYEKKTPVRFSAHTDGTPRHIFFELDAKEALIEEVDGHKGTESWFRSGMFSTVDRDGDLSNGPRGFIHAKSDTTEEGAITISVVRGERFTTRLEGDPQTDFGPQDTVRAMVSQPIFPEPPRKTASEISAHTEGIGSPVEERPRVWNPVKQQWEIQALDVPGAPRPEFSAGFVPYSIRDEVWQEVPGGGITKVSRQVHERTRVDPEPLAEPTPMVPRLEYEARGGTGAPIRDEFDPNDQLADRFSRYFSVEGVATPRGVIEKGPGLTAPELVDAQRAARILLDTKNIDPNTPVRVITTSDVHAAYHDAPFSWTLEELAKVEFGLASFPEVRALGMRKGYAAIPDGEGVILRDTVTNSEVKFATRLEALNWLGKIRAPELGPKLEGEIERVLRLGWLGSFDGQVDGGKFVDADAQRVAFDALVNGDRPGVVVWTASEGKIGELDERLAAREYVQGASRPQDLRQRKPEAAAQLEKEVDELVGVDRALRELEDRLGVPRNTFGHLELETQGDKTLTVIYNRDRVRALIHKHGSDLHRLLKADPTNPDKLMQSLAKREAGVDILQHPDTQSGILYAYFKNAHQRDLMLSGRLVEDAATGRNYRVYDARVKAQFLQTARRTGVEQVPDGQIVDVDTARPDVELRDFIEHPPELNFDGIDPKAPPPIMETPLSGPGDPVPNPKVDWGTGFFADRFMPRMNLYLKWQERSGVRFYDYFSDIEQAREAATNEFAPFRHFLDQMRWRIRNAEDRTNVQLLLEARIAGREQEVAALEKKMSTKLVEQTKLLETEWRKYLKGIGFEDAEIQASFGDIAQLRKVRGDFKAYAGARTALPRMMTFLRQQLQRGNTPLRIDERETDFYSLGVRLSRLLAYEKHVTPVWNDVGKKLEQDSKVVSIPIDVFNNFKEYMYQVMHTPDDVMVATSRTIRGMHRRLDAAMRKVTFGKFGAKYNPSDEETLDVLGVLSSVGYAANLAFNSATAIQQYFALFQTVWPLLGSSATRTGFKAAVRWFRDPKLQEDMARRGVAGKSSFAQPLAMMEEFMESKGALRSTAALAVAKFVQWGSVPLQVGDDFTRVAAYMGRHEQVMKYGRQYRDGKISWQQFREKTRLDLLDGKNGPITRAIKEAIDAGDLQAGAHRAADFTQKLALFMYNRGTTPRALDGAMGRLLGQYGTYPLGFLNYLHHIATVGDEGLTKNKIKAMGAMLAWSIGALEAMEAAFGGDASKWATWNSFFYRGGPYLELAYMLGVVATAPEDDPVARIYRARIATQLGTGWIPGARAAARYARAAEAVANGDLQAAVRALIGMGEGEGQPRERTYGLR